MRIDKWLWQARFVKTRTLAARLIADGNVRLNSVRMTKPGHVLRPGDVLTFAQGAQVQVVRVVAAGLRRGPASEAQMLYEDLSPPAPPDLSPQDMPPEAPRHQGKGRPTKRDRRKLDQGRTSALE